MRDREFLNWVADRFVYVYKENAAVDFVQKLRAIAETIPGDTDTPFQSYL